MQKGELITTGKAKSLYETDDSDYLILHYRDDTSAFDGKKMEALDNKGKVNKLHFCNFLRKKEYQRISRNYYPILIV